MYRPDVFYHHSKGMVALFHENEKPEEVAKWFQAKTITGQIENKRENGVLICWPADAAGQNQLQNVAINRANKDDIFGPVGSVAERFSYIIAKESMRLGGWKGLDVNTQSQIKKDPSLRAEVVRFLQKNGISSNMYFLASGGHAFVIKDKDTNLVVRVVHNGEEKRANHPYMLQAKAVQEFSRGGIRAEILPYAPSLQDLRQKEIDASPDNHQQIKDRYQACAEKFCISLIRNGYWSTDLTAVGGGLKFDNIVVNPEGKMVIGDAGSRIIPIAPPAKGSGVLKFAYQIDENCLKFLMKAHGLEKDDYRVSKTQDYVQVTASNPKAVDAFANLNIPKHKAPAAQNPDNKKPWWKLWHGGADPALDITGEFSNSRQRQSWVQTTARQTPSDSQRILGIPNLA